MNKPKLFVCEKPNSAKSIQSITSEGDVIILAQCTAAYHFDYQSINFKDAPYSKEIPKYKYNKKFKNTIFNIGVFDNKGNHSDSPTLISIEKNKTAEEMDEFFENFSEVIFACDSDLSGYRGFSFRMKYFFNLGENWINYFEKKFISLTTVKIKAFDRNSLRNSYKNRKEIKNNKEMERFKDNYLKKDYFEYNYNLNSMLFFNQALADIGYVKNGSENLLTKNYIWLALYLSKKESSESELIYNMERAYIANACSRHAIIENMIVMNLIERANCKKGKILRLTRLGFDFINKLHKKVDDPFIGLRLILNNHEYRYFIHGTQRAKSENLSLDSFKEKYEKYLYQTFSKQKRFLRKKI
jgi:hypothetical protein